MKERLNERMNANVDSRWSEIYYSNGKEHVYMRMSSSESERSNVSVINIGSVSGSSKEKENVKSKRWKESVKRNEKESACSALG